MVIDYLVVGVIQSGFYLFLVISAKLLHCFEVFCNVLNLVVVVLVAQVLTVLNTRPD